MPCHPKEPEFQVRDIPSLRGYIAIVTGGMSSGENLPGFLTY